MHVNINYRISEETGCRFAVVPLEQFTELLERAGEVDTLKTQSHKGRQLSSGRRSAADSASIPK